MAYRVTGRRINSQLSGDANLEDHLRQEIAREKQKTTEMQQQLKAKQEQKQRMLDSDKQQEIEDLKRKLLVESSNKDDSIQEKQRRENKLHDEKIRQLKKEHEEDMRRLEQSMAMGADANKIPVETICKATAVTLTIVLLKRGIRCRSNSSSWRECCCFAPWQRSTLYFRPGDTMKQGKLFVRLGNTVDSVCSKIGLDGLFSSTKVLELDKLIAVRYGPLTKGKRSINPILSRGRVDLVFNGTPTVVSLQFEGEQSTAHGTSLPADTNWYDGMHGDKLASFIAVGLQEMRDKEFTKEDRVNDQQVVSQGDDCDVESHATGWLTDLRIHYDSQKQTKAAEISKIGAWLDETHRAMCRLLNVSPRWGETAPGAAGHEMTFSSAEGQGAWTLDTVGNILPGEGDEKWASVGKVLL